MVNRCRRMTYAASRFLLGSRGGKLQSCRGESRLLTPRAELISSVSRKAPPAIGGQWPLSPPSRESKQPLSELPVFVLVRIDVLDGVPLEWIAVLGRKSLRLFFVRIGLISLSHSAELAFPRKTPDTWQENVEAHR